MNRKLLTLFLLGCMSLSTKAQEVSTKAQVSDKQINQQLISGKVISQVDGLPIISATIYVKGNRNFSTVTDEQGFFTLKLPQDKSTLIVSYMGFDNKEVNISANEKDLVVSLIEAENMLNQVIITALGVKKSTKAVTNSVTELKGTDFAKSKEVSIANALVGKIAGVNATSTSTGANGSSRVVIRGNGSLNGNNQPMYVVNDLPLDNTQLNLPMIGNGERMNVDRGDGISGINPDDIKSITILKGGTAAALYGSMAANGVILIRTKTGTAQKGIGVEYNSNYTVETPSIKPDWQYEYGQGQLGMKPVTEAEALATGRWSWGAKIDGSDVIQFDGVKRPYVAQRNNIKNFYRMGETFTNTLALTGGSEIATGRLSFSNMENKSIVPNSDFNRKTINLASELNLTSWLHLDAVVQYNNEQSNNRPTVSDAESNPNWGTYMIANTVDIRSLGNGYDENGIEMPWNPVPIASNPLFVVNKIKNYDTKDRFISMLNLKVNVTPELFLQGRVGQDLTNYKFFGYLPLTTLNNPIGYVQSNKVNLINRNSELSLNYNKKDIYKDISLNAIVGLNSKTNLRDEEAVNGSGMTLPDFYSLSNFSTLNYSYPYGKTKTNSVYGALDLDYKNLVYLSLTGRQDWFSTLSPENNTIFYPSVGTSIILSEIVPMPSWISFAKLRSSWAQVGGATPEPYVLNNSYSIRQGGHIGQQLQGLTGTRVANSGLSPLTSTTIEIGTDLSFFNNKLYLDFAWYNRATTNDIVESTISPASGFNSALLNIGKMRNKGIELLLSAKAIRTDNFSWETSINGSYNKNVVESLADGVESLTMASSVNGYVTITSDVGGPYSIIKGYKPLLDASGNKVYNVSGGSATLVQGPLEKLGEGVHPVGIGFNNDFKYKNFNFSFLIDGKFGGSLYSGTNLYGTRMGLTKLTLEGRESGLPISGVDRSGNPVNMTIAPADLRTYYDGFRNISSEFVYDASFVKLRQVILGYQLPLEKISFLSKVNSITVSFVARNLFILYKKTPGIDPESVFSAGNAQGVEQFGVPRTRSYGLNLSVKL